MRQLTLMVVCGVLLGAAVNPRAGAAAPAAAAVPAEPDNPLLALVPGAADAGPPAWVHPGTRLVYYGQAARILGSQRILVPGVDADGNVRWETRETGEQWHEENAAPASGGGPCVFQVGAVDGQTVQLICARYLLDTIHRTITLPAPSRSGMVTRSSCARGLWVNPALLKNIQETKDQPKNQDIFTRIRRVPFTLQPFTGNPRKYEALSVETTTGNGATLYVLDLETGVGLFFGSCVNSGFVWEPGVTEAHAGGTGTQLTTSWLMEIKDVDVPWKGAAAPAWVGQYQELSYRGAMSTALPGAPRLDTPLNSTLTVKRRGQGWMQYSTATAIGGVAGVPAVPMQTEDASGSGNIGGLWISPESIGKLHQGQVIDTIDFRCPGGVNAKVQMVVSDAGARGATISEIGPLHRIDWSYSAGNGMLTAAKVTTQVAAAQVTTQIQLAGTK